MQVRGNFIIRAGQQPVWEFIRNPVNLQSCIPGCQSIEERSSSHYTATIGIRLGPIAPSFNLDIRVTEEQAPNYIACSITGEEGGRASSVKATSEFWLFGVFRLAGNWFGFGC